jgi:hypothetical protein
MTAQAESGVLIGFIISKDYHWELLLADETRDYKVDTSEPVVLQVDERDPILATAKVIDVHGILMPLGDPRARRLVQRQGADHRGKGGKVQL